MSEPKQMTPSNPPVVVPVLLGLTAVTGMVDAVSFLALGHVFTANMTGNVVFLGFALAGTAGLSVPRSLLALFFFFLGAIVGGRIPGTHAVRAFTIEAMLLLAAAAMAFGLAAPYERHPIVVYSVIATTALAMGLRNAVVRHLAVPDLTTTVLTLTITGLGSESVWAGGSNPRWQRRCASVAAMVIGGAAGAILLSRSAALTLGVAAVGTAACTLVAYISQRKEKSAW